MEVKIKKLDEKVIIPQYKRKGDAGMDLIATWKDESNPMYIMYGTGISMEIPTGYAGLVFPRSSLSNYDLIQADSVAVIDSGYRGEIWMRYKRTRHAPVRSYNVGDAIGQMIIIPYPEIEFIEAELGESERGDQGDGSTDYMNPEIPEENQEKSETYETN